MSAVDQTAEQFIETITGYEEHKVRGAFGKPFMKLGEDDVLDMARAAAFVHFDRAGEGDPKDRALSLTIGELNTFFREDDATAEGKSVEAVEAGKAKK